MSLADRIQRIPRRRNADARGWFVKVIDGAEPGLPDRPGEVYVAQAVAGQVRGNHYHRATNEWFNVVQGSAEVALVEVETGERMEFLLRAAEAVTLFIPAGVAHVFRCPDDAAEPALIVAFADRRYEPSDTVPLDCAWPRGSS